MLKAYSLICHRDVPQALHCLGSFVSLSQDRIELRLFNDGSLTPNDINTLCHGLNISEDAIHGIQNIPELNKYPHLQKARDNYVMCRKLLDIPLIDSAPKLILDTDVLFLRPFSGLQNLANESQFICMRDQQSSYSPSLLDRIRLRLNGRRMISHANAGILLADPAIIDLDLLEYFFSRQQHLRFPALVEQTAWALLGSNAKNPSYWAPGKVTFPPAGLQPSAESITWHFASDYRGMLSEVEERPPLTTPASFSIEPAETISITEEFIRTQRNIRAKLRKQ